MAGNRGPNAQGVGSFVLGLRDSPATRHWSPRNRLLSRCPTLGTPETPTSVCQPQTALTPPPQINPLPTSQGRQQFQIVIPSPPCLPNVLGMPISQSSGCSSTSARSATMSIRDAFTI